MSIAGALDKELAVPLYHQLQSVLKAEIESRKWCADEQLPNETKIAERFGVSKITVRKALQKLAELGYIRREHGRGTFVARRKFDEGPRELTSFTEEMRRHDLAATSRVLGQYVVEADARVADALLVPLHSPIFVLKRVRLAGGEPMSVQTAHIPAAFVPGFEVMEGLSLCEVLQSRYIPHPGAIRCGGGCQGGRRAPGAAPLADFCAEARPAGRRRADECPDGPHPGRIRAGPRGDGRSFALRGFAEPLPVVPGPGERTLLCRRGESARGRTTGHTGGIACFHGGTGDASAQRKTF